MAKNKEEKKIKKETQGKETGNPISLSTLVKVERNFKDSKYSDLINPRYIVKIGSPFRKKGRCPICGGVIEKDGNHMDVSKGVSLKCDNCRFKANGGLYSNYHIMVTLAHPMPPIVLTFKNEQEANQAYFNLVVPTDRGLTTMYNYVVDVRRPNLQRVEENKKEK